MTFKSAVTALKEASRRVAEGSIAASLTMVRLLVGCLKSFFGSQGSLRDRKEVVGWYMWIIKNVRDSGEDETLVEKGEGGTTW